MLLVKFYKGLEMTSAATVVIPLLLCVSKIKTLQTSVRVLFFYLIICAITECLNSVCTGGQSAGIIQNTFTLSESLLLTWVYFIIFNSQTSRRIIRIIMLGYLLLAAFLFLFVQPYTEANDILTTTEAWIMILMALAFFYKTMTDLKIPKLTDNYAFWFSVAIISYFSTASIIFLFNQQLTQSLPIESFQRLYIPQLIMNIFYHLLLAICIWKARLS